jgi:hypothetical protein
MRWQVCKRNFSNSKFNKFHLILRNLMILRNLKSKCSERMNGPANQGLQFLGRILYF